MNILLLLVISYFPGVITGQTAIPVVDYNSYYMQHYGHYDSYNQWEGFDKRFGEIQYSGIPLVSNYFNTKINYTSLVNNFDFSVNNDIIPKPQSKYTLISTYHNKNFIYINIPVRTNNSKMTISQNYLRENSHEKEDMLFLTNINVGYKKKNLGLDLVFDNYYDTFGKREETIFISPVFYWDGKRSNFSKINFGYETHNSINGSMIASGIGMENRLICCVANTIDLNLYYRKYSFNNIESDLTKEVFVTLNEEFKSKSNFSINPFVEYKRYYLKETVFFWTVKMGFKAGMKLSDSVSVKLKINEVNEVPLLEEINNFQNTFNLSKGVSGKLTVNYKFMFFDINGEYTHSYFYSYLGDNEKNRFSIDYFNGYVNYFPANELNLLIYYSYLKNSIVSGSPLVLYKIEQNIGLTISYNSKLFDFSTNIYERKRDKDLIGYINLEVSKRLYYYKLSFFINDITDDFVDTKYILQLTSRFF